MTRHDPCGSAGAPVAAASGEADSAWRAGVAEPELVQPAVRSSAARARRNDRTTMADPTAHAPLTGGRAAEPSGPSQNRTPGCGGPAGPCPGDARDVMDRPLLTSGVLRHAERIHGDQEIVRRRGGESTKTTFAGLARRARLLGVALTAGGVRPGQRIGTLAPNTIDHVEILFAVTGIGAVFHPIPSTTTTTSGRCRPFPATSTGRPGRCRASTRPTASEVFRRS